MFKLFTGKICGRYANHPFPFCCYNRENLSAPSILVTASASSVQIANLTILWEPLCTEPQPHRQVMRQPCTTSWHPHQGILKDCSTEGPEGLIGFPKLIPSKYPLAMEALRERRHKPPSSAFPHAYSHSCLFSNYLPTHSKSWSCTGPRPSFLRCSELPHSGASPCVTFKQEKVLAHPTLVPVCPLKNNGVTIHIYPSVHRHKIHSLLDPFVVVIQVTCGEQSLPNWLLGLQLLPIFPFALIPF